MGILTKEIQNNVLNTLENKIGKKPILDFEKYENNKTHLYDDFGGNFILSKPFEAEIDMQDKIALFDGFLRLLYIRLNTRTAATVSEFLNENGIEGFFENRIIKSILSDGLKFGKGMKLSRALIQLISRDDLNEFTINDIANAYSVCRSKMKLKGNLNISIHPLDYLSMSMNNCGWRSCHALDGDYAAGTLSLMFDKVTVIAYISSSNLEKIDYLNVDWNSKKWRVLVHIDESKNRFIISKHYPFYSRSAETGVLNFLKEIYPYMSTYEASEIDEHEIKEVLNNAKGRMHYSDLTARTVSHRITQLFCNSEDVKKIIVGASVPCLFCGEYDIIESLEFACDNCKADSYCDICGNSCDYNDLTYIENEDQNICDDCFAHHFVVCFGCNSEHRPDDMYYTDDGRIYCDNCNAD